MSHRTPDCDGHWVSIATFGSPNLYLCSRCRTTATLAESEDGLVTSPAIYIHDELAATPPEPLPSPPSHAGIWVAILVAASAFAFVFGLAAGLRSH